MDVGRGLVHMNDRVEHPQVRVPFLKCLGKLLESCRSPFPLRRFAAAVVLVSDLEDDLMEHYLGDFDSAMVHLIESVKNIQDTPVIEVWHNDGDQVLAYRRKNLIFVFNFNPTKSFTDYGFLVPVGAYDVVLNTDATAFGGNGLADDSIRHFTNFDPLYKKDKKEWLKLYLPARSAVVLKKVKE